MNGQSASTRDFFDTNVLVYAYDHSEPHKRRRALDLLVTAMERESGVLSAQVLGEFFTTVTRRIPDPLSIDEAEEVIRQVTILPVMDLDLALVHRAVGTSRRYHISYWDALIIAAAERAGCLRIFSEDLNSGQSYNGILIENPFS
jgi:predicted nucleic acid-binding protein